MASPQLELYTAPTPNGYKVSIMLEELQVPYELHKIDFSKKEQKEDWFLAMNPNGRIPVIRDKQNNLVLFESGAILVYLAETYDMKLYGETPKERYTTLQWVMFQMGGIGPMQGQANVFYRYAPEKIQYAVERYQKETRRLYEVLETALKGKEYITGKYSIADIACFPWVVRHEWAGVSVEGLPNVQGWLDRIGKRPAVQRGLVSPPRVDTTDQKVSQGRSILV
ncbi:Disulfide-bond oxidoreductase YfcG [Galdieria sulphuraria]|uniref:Glutathione S-transferase n=1 Tax=Galdieria sulphuraria TaxID=130081 RepID=M2X016_GALSU|nr:glutathione S-transferase [Galdieria sulphuraria]EME29675.1 glutathione S-transferase [Galdieria sulphuraria]GJD12174.1 Disulfide-bond oxidoreductase YfcG [Galdieria sulphuraria]|eukprot:XP_005706195.1 glutathione S-transferase [Galdieria sulphuraria]